MHKWNYIKLKAGRIYFKWAPVFTQIWLLAVVYSPSRCPWESLRRWAMAPCWGAASFSCRVDRHLPALPALVLEQDTELLLGGCWQGWITHLSSGLHLSPFTQLKKQLIFATWTHTYYANCFKEAVFSFFFYQCLHHNFLLFYSSLAWKSSFKPFSVSSKMST